MNRSRGIIIILVGAGLLFTSFIFSSGSSPKRDFLGNLSLMEIVFVEGKFVPDSNYSGHFEGEVAIPLKYPLFLSIVLILIGTGIYLVPKKTESNA